MKQGKPSIVLAFTEVDTMRVAAEVKLSDEQRGQLEKLARARSATVRLAQRSKMMLMAAEGVPDLKIAAELGRSEERRVGKECRL